MDSTLVTVIEHLLHSDVVATGAFGAWLATFLTGENGALLVLALAEGGYLPLPIALSFTFLGSLSADLFWYLVTVGALRSWFERRFPRTFGNDAQKESRPFFSIAERHPYLLLTFIKFLVGVRLVLTVYIVAKKRIPLRTYIIINTVANAIFIGVLYALVALSSHGASHTVGAGGNVKHLLTTIVVVVVGVNVFLRLLEHLVARVLKRGRNNTSQE